MLEEGVDDHDGQIVLASLSLSRHEVIFSNFCALKLHWDRWSNYICCLCSSLTRTKYFNVSPLSSTSDYPYVEKEREVICHPPVMTSAHSLLPMVCFSRTGSNI